ncbi:hypothetical protein HID58_052464 [Brassica napus]|uniref:(rape) hypothetical protein n=2 Tax=Brassica napus TaxID=3708 RepID=A0A816I3R6_BRANA|nr:hypothetical protein HID58_052464 [Brassica napus]CAF1701431.1 unnamed protein product [Brassica napus]
MTKQALSPPQNSLSLFTYLSEPQQRPPSSKVFRIEFYDYESDFEFKLCGLNLSLSETSLKGSLCVFSLFREKMGSTTLLDVSRAELGLVVMYLNKAEARDKLCRAIQYGSKFLSGGQPGTAQNVDKSTSLARKVFRLFKFVNDLHGLISPVPKGTPLPLVLLGKSKNALLSTFLFLDQIVWLGRSGIYKNKERAELLGRISLFCWMGSSVCTTLVEIGEIGRLSSSMKKIEKGLKNGNKYQDEEYRAKIKQSNERSLALIKAAMDIVVAAGLLQLYPKKITPRVTGAFGFITSLISCYQLLPSRPKIKAP